jgi:hypothetical protein
MKTIEQYYREERTTKYDLLTIQTVFSYNATTEGIEYKFTLGYISNNTYFYINTFEETFEDYNKFIRACKTKVLNYLAEDESKFKSIFIQDILF